MATRDEIRSAIHRARQITSMLQGTMGLEGQALDAKTLREMKRRTIRDLLQADQAQDYSKVLDPYPLSPPSRLMRNFEWFGVIPPETKVTKLNLSARDGDRFLASLGSDAEPNEALRKAAHDYRLAVDPRDQITEADADALRRIATDPNATSGVVNWEPKRCPPRSRAVRAKVEYLGRGKPLPDDEGSRSSYEGETP